MRFCSLAFVSILAAAYVPAQTSANAYRIRTIAGGVSNGDGGPATSGLLLQAQGLAFDNEGRLYIADANDHRVRRIEVSGAISTVAGSGLAGTAGDGGAAIAARLENPYGIAIDSADNLYIADVGAARVRLVKPNGIISTVAGGGTTTPGGGNDGAPGTSYLLGAPRNLARDAAGNLYISDFSRSQVYQLASDGTLTTIAGTGTSGYSGDFGAAIAAQLNAPAGLTVQPDGTLLICDSGNRAIRQLAHGMISTFLPSVSGDIPVQFSAPTSIQVSQNAIVYVADPGAGAVAAISLTAKTVAYLPAANDLALDANSVLYESHAADVTRLDVNAQPTTVAGMSVNGFLGEGVLAIAARLNTPTGVAEDALGNIYIADRQTNRIRRVDPSGIISTVAGNGTAGYSGDGGPAAAAQLSGPSSIAIDGSGNLIIADTGNHVLRLLAVDGTIRTIAGTGASGKANDGSAATGAPLNAPAFVLAAGARLYVSDTGNSSVRVIDEQGNIYRIAGTDVAGTTGDGGAATQAMLVQPRGLAIDAGGNLCIADEGAGAVRCIHTNGIIAAATTTATGPWISPSGIVATPDGSLLISDSGTHEVRQLKPDGSVAVIAGLGAIGFEGDNGPATDARLNSPEGLALNNRGEILIADTGNNRVRLLDGGAVASNTRAAKIFVRNAASGSSGALAPGEIVRVSGGSISTGSALLRAQANAATLPVILGTTQVLVNGIAAPLLLAQDGEISLQVPYEVAGATSVLLEVFTGGVSAGSITLPVVPTLPGLYMTSGRTQALALLANGSFNSRANRLTPGTAATVYLTGEGVLTGGSSTGTAITVAQSPVSAISVMVGGTATTVQNIAEVIGTEGTLAVTFLVPTTLAAGAYNMNVTIGSSTTQRQALLWVGGS